MRLLPKTLLLEDIWAKIAALNAHKAPEKYLQYAERALDLRHTQQQRKALNVKKNLILILRKLTANEKKLQKHCVTLQRQKHRQPAQPQKATRLRSCTPHNHRSKKGKWLQSCMLKMHSRYSHKAVAEVHELAMLFHCCNSQQ